MTFSILCRDEETGILAAAAATGSLCVGGWVIRGDLESGLVASQGTAPSTIWRDGALCAMRAGATAAEAVRQVTGADPGRAHRQLAALDLAGGTAAFTGAESVPTATHHCEENLALAGNMISGHAPIEAMRRAALERRESEGHRMLAVLKAAHRSGGDLRGLQSAALLVLAPDRPPLDLRVDLADDPLAELERLHAAATSPPYADWLDDVPVRDDPVRAPSHPLSSAAT